MDAIQCFWIEPTGQAWIALRRYSRGHRYPDPMDCEHGWHHAKTRGIEQLAIERDERGILRAPDWPHDDPRWPAGCDAGCGYRFSDEDTWQVWIADEWATSSGEHVCWDLRNAPPGAMWDARWMGDGSTGDDGIHLTIQLPDSLPWLVDGPATGSHGKGKPPHDTRTGHRCWTRTGDPRAMPPTVSARPSILTPGYHGWLRDGRLYPA